MTKAVLIFALLLSVSGCVTPELPPESPMVSLYPTVQSMDVLKVLSPVELGASEVSRALAEAQAYSPLVEAGLADDVFAVALRGLKTRGYAEIDCRRACMAKRCPFQMVTLEHWRERGLLVRVRYLERPTKEQCLGLSVEYLSEARRGASPGPYGGWSDYFCWESKSAEREIAVYQMERPSDDKGAVYHWDVVVLFPEEKK